MVYCIIEDARCFGDSRKIGMLNFVRCAKWKTWKMTEISFFFFISRRAPKNIVKTIFFKFLKIFLEGIWTFLKFCIWGSIQLKIYLERFMINQIRKKFWIWRWKLKIYILNMFFIKNLRKILILNQN